MRGIGNLRTPQDLRAKLQRDLQRLEADPANADAAFDFFVTAYHLVDWVRPDVHRRGDHTRERDKVREREPLLRIAGHIANGSKHFKVFHWQRVDAVEVQGAWFSPWWFGSNFWPKGYWGTARLVIHLSPSEARRVGSDAIGALDTARKLYAFWEMEI